MTLIRFLRLITFSILIVPVLPLAAQESQKNQVFGRVTAAQDSKPLAGVMVRLLGTSGETAEAVTREDGWFSFPQVPAGAYTIEVKVDGFQEFREQVVIAATSNPEIAVSLKLRTITDTVEVTDRAAESVLQAASTPEILDARAVDSEAIRGDNFQALLPLVPGVVRGMDGRINIKGAGAVQSGLMVSSSSASDPSTGNPGLELPIDAIETVDVLTNPYNAEYGRFSSGVTQIQTKKGESHWGILFNNLVPSQERWRDGHLMGIERFTPRISFNGPLIRDRLFIAQSFQYRFIKTPVPGLPPQEGDQRFESFDSFTRFDAILTRIHQLEVTVAVFPKKQDFINLNQFNPIETTANLHNRGVQAGVQESALFDNTRTLDSTLTFRSYDSDVFGQGTQPMDLFVSSNGGNYFNRQARRTSTAQWTEMYTRLLPGSMGHHLLKIGSDLLRAEFTGSSRSATVSLFRRDSTLNTRIEYPSPSYQNVRTTTLGFYGQDHWRIGSRIALDFGLRVDRDGVLARFNAAPRAGFVLSVLPEGKGVLRGGLGLFYDQTPMNVAAFPVYERQKITPYSLDGATPSGSPVSWSHRISPDLHTPYSVIWNLEYDHRINENWIFRLNYLRRNGIHEYLVDPVARPSGPEYYLDSRGRSRYQEFEATIRYARGDVLSITWSYVRSKSRADLNSYDLFFGNFRDPIIRPNEFGRTPVDAPNRFVSRSMVPLPMKLKFSTIVDVRDGFPFSAFNQERNYVGARNGAGRFPLFKSVDLRLSRPLRIWKYKVDAGLFLYHMLNSFTPRIVQGNIDAADYGTFYNTIRREWGITVIVSR